MAKSRNRKPSESRCYDVAMVRDFLDHLMWELRINHFEVTTKPGTINEELVDQLARYQKKRQTMGLMMSTVLGPAVDREAWKAKQAELRQRQIEAMELLMPLFEEALECASHPKHACVRKVETLD